MASSNQENQMNSVNSVSETLTVDGASVQPSPAVNISPTVNISPAVNTSPAVNCSSPSTHDILLAALFDDDEDPEQAATYDVFNGDDSFWPEILNADGYLPMNPEPVSIVEPLGCIPADANENWAYNDDGGDDPPKVDELYDSKAKPSLIGAGLANLGNTCFLNSIMQCLIHTVTLVEGLLLCSHNPNDGHTGYCVICAFRYLIHLSMQSTGRIVSPVILVDNLSHFSSIFRRHQQEDAHEFMQCALDKLETCYINLKKNDPRFSDDNIVKKVFGGSLISKLRCCNCGQSSNTNDPMIDLSLQIENVDTVLSALQSFTMVENMDGKFQCEGCNAEVSKEKQLMLDHAPAVAALHLKRFKTDGLSVEKIDKHIGFPPELDLQPYILNGKNDVSSKYNLYAVVVHNGFSSNSGHYFCFVCTAPGTWHKLDDSKVTKVSEETVLSQEAYILFYARQDTPWFSSYMESLLPCLDLCSMNTSPKSVLDITEGQDKSFPILNENVERSEAGTSKEFSEKKFDNSCQKTHEFFGMNDIDAAADCEQIPAGSSNQETLDLNGLKDINAQVVPPVNCASLTDIAKHGESSYAETGAPDKNQHNLQVFDFIEKDVFNHLTPPNSPPTHTPGKSFQISRDHLKTEKNQGSCKRSSSTKSNKSSDNPEKKAAITCLSKMHGSRRGAFMDLIDKASPENKRKKTDSPQSDKGNNLSARKKSNHASASGYPVVAGTSK